MIRSQLLVVILAHCCIAWSCYGEDDVYYQGPLELTIRTDAKQCVLYEPIFAVVSLVNTGTEEVIFPCSSLSTLWFFESYENGPWKSCVSGGSSGAILGGRYTLSPGGTEVLRIRTLFYNERDDEFVLARAGRYGLKARMRLGRGEIMESKPIYVNVREGTEADNEAARLLVEGGAWNVIQSSYFRNEPALASLKSAVEKHPGSVLADYARYYLGFADYFWLRKATTCDPAQAERAVGYFRSITGRRESLAFRGFLGQAQVTAVCGRVGDSTPPGEFRRALEAKMPQAKQLGLEIPARQTVQRLAEVERRESAGKGRK